MAKNKKQESTKNLKIIKKIFDSIEIDRKNATTTFSEIYRTLTSIDVESFPDAYAKTTTSQIKAVECLQKSTEQMINMFNTYSKNNTITEEEINDDFYEQLYSSESVEIDQEEES